MDGEALYFLERVGVTAGGRDILRDVNVSVRAGEWTAVTGPSGSGKTTLLKLLAFLLRPTEGRVLFRGREADRRGITSLRRRTPLTLQEPVLVGESVRENLLLPFSFHSSAGSKAPSDDRMKEILQEVDLKPGMLDSPVVRLSGGEKQRVAAARALVLEPDVLLLDEPTSALDSVTAGRMFDNLKRSRPGLSLVAVTHSADLIEKTATQLLVCDGRICAVEKGLSDARLREFLEERK